MPLHKAEVVDEGTDEETVIIDKYTDPFIVLKYSISSSVTRIASLALLFSNLLTLFVQ